MRIFLLLRGRRAVRGAFYFSGQRGKKSRNSLFGEPLEHTLAHAGDKAADLYFARIKDISFSPGGFQTYQPFSLEKSRPSFALDDQLVLGKGLLILQSNVTVKGSFEGANPNFQDSLIRIFACEFHLFTTRNASGQELRVY